MTLALIYWILMLAWLVLGTDWSGARTNWRPAAGSVLLFVLLLVIGWSVYGSPVKT